MPLTLCHKQKVNINSPQIHVLSSTHVLEQVLSFARMLQQKNLPFCVELFLLRTSKILFCVNFTWKCIEQKVVSGSSAKTITLLHVGNVFCCFNKVIFGYILRVYVMLILMMIKHNSKTITKLHYRPGSNMFLWVHCRSVGAHHPLYGACRRPSV